MKNYYMCSVRYRKTTDHGTQKITTDAFLIDAVSYTEAELRITEQMQAYIGEEFRITNIKTTNYSEVVAFEDCDTWFKSKVSLVAYDEESGKERKVNIYILVQADNAKQAYENTQTVMANTMGDFTIPAVVETAIVEVFNYQD